MVNSPTRPTLDRFLRIAVAAAPSRGSQVVAKRSPATLEKVTQRGAPVVRMRAYDVQKRSPAGVRETARCATMAG
jgi:hypothetical protein